MRKNDSKSGVASFLTAVWPWFVFLLYLALAVLSKWKGRA